MVTFMSYVTADLQNITNLQPNGGTDDPNFTYYLKLKCENCGEITGKETCVSLTETVSVSKCKFCKREGSVTMIPGKGIRLTLEMSERGMYAPLMLFDFKGYVPLEFAFSGCWKAESVKGTKFVDIDLAGGDFAEYDEEGKCGVMISNVRSCFKFYYDKWLWSKYNTARAPAIVA